MKNKNIVVIGGGTGSFTALTGLKKHSVNLTAIITTMDSGGSSGRLRDELGVLPPGDIRQCLVALSNSPRTLRSLFNYRFTEGDLKGHTLGNILLSGLEKTTGDLGKAVKVAEKILRIQGKVVPVTLDRTELCVELADGEIIKGETHIDVLEKQVQRARIKRAFLDENAKANPDAIESLEKADAIIIGPGDIYTSIIPNLLVDGISDAIKKSKAVKIFVMNIMTKHGQTTNYKASDHIEDLEKYIGESTLDVVLVNSKKPTKKTLSWYEEYEEKPVENDLSGKFSIVNADLIKEAIVSDDSSDELRRGIIRHHPTKLADELLKIINSTAPIK